MSVEQARGRRLPPPPAEEQQSDPFVNDASLPPPRIATVVVPTDAALADVLDEDIAGDAAGPRGAGGSSSVLRGPSTLWGFFQSRTAQLLLYGMFFAYLVVIPMVLVLDFYLDGLQVLLCVVCALGPPAALYHLLWKHEVARLRAEERQRQLQRRANEMQRAAGGGMMEDIGATLYERRVRALTASAASIADIFRVVSTQYVYELYQLLLTLLSCALYIAYSYNLRFVWTPPDDQAGTGGRGDYSLLFSDSDGYVQAEYFLSLSLSLDYLLRLLSARSKSRFISSYYSFIDLACFSVVAYGGFWHKQLAPSDVVLNAYLLQGPFRFLRFRRALKSLDRPVRSGRGADELAIYRLGPFVLSRRAAFIVLLVLRVFLFICSAAALVLALEFPCDALAPAEECSFDLRRFHVSVYFTVVTLSTVGFGDVSARTDAGRIWVTIFIIAALVAVPREIQAFTDLEAEQRALEEKVRKKRLEELQQQQQVGEDAQGEESSQRRMSMQDQLWPAGDSASAEFNKMSAPSPAHHTRGASVGGGMSPQVLGAFLADDRALLARWGTLQLSALCASQPELLQRLQHALQLDDPAAATLEQQCARIVGRLFAPQDALSISQRGDAFSPNAAASPSASAAFPAAASVRRMPVDANTAGPQWRASD